MILDELVSTYARDDRGITHLLALREGGVVAEWYRPGRGRRSAHMLHSATKSFVGTAIGIAVDEGLLSLEDRLFDFLTAEQIALAAPGADRLTLADLLTMRTGHREGTSGVVWRTLTTSWVDEYLRMPITGEPGRDYIYSSGTAHMLSLCLQRATGTAVDEYLAPRLFEPLDFAGYAWERDPEGICSGGNGLTLNILDFAKWGQLHLAGGEWNGRRIISRAWVEASLARHVDVGSLIWTGDGFGADETTAPGEGEGYGYQIWNRPGGAYASGIFGQYCVIVPDADAVIAVFSSMTSAESEPLSLDLIEAARSDGFALFTPPLVSAATLERTPAHADVVAAMLQGRHASDDDGTDLSFEVVGSDRGPALRVRGRDAAGSVDVIAGLGHVHESEGPLGSPSLHHSYDEITPVLASVEHAGPWSLDMRVTYPVTPFVDTLSFVLENDGVLTYRRRVNVNSQRSELPQATLRRR